MPERKDCRAVIVEDGDGSKEEVICVSDDDWLGVWLGFSFKNDRRKT